MSDLLSKAGFAGSVSQPFPSGAMIAVDVENLPCRHPAAIIQTWHPEQKLGAAAAARHKRGVAGWIAAEGEIRTGDAISIWLPPKRPYEHG